VAVGVEAELELALGVELPHAARAVAANPTAARGIQFELLRITCDASVIRSRSESPAWCTMRHPALLSRRL